MALVRRLTLDASDWIAIASWPDTQQSGLPLAIAELVGSIYRSFEDTFMVAKRCHDGVQDLYVCSKPAPGRALVLSVEWMLRDDAKHIRLFVLEGVPLLRVTFPVTHAPRAYTRSRARQVLPAAAAAAAASTPSPALCHVQSFDEEWPLPPNPEINQQGKLQLRSVATAIMRQCNALSVHSKPVVVYTLFTKMPFIGSQDADMYHCITIHGLDHELDVRALAAVPGFSLFSSCNVNFRNPHSDGGLGLMYAVHSEMLHDLAEVCAASNDAVTPSAASRAASKRAQYASNAAV